MRESQTGSFSKAPPNAQKYLGPVAWLLGANDKQPASATPMCDGVFDVRLETATAGEEGGRRRVHDERSWAFVDVNVPGDLFEIAKSGL